MASSVQERKLLWVITRGLLDIANCEPNFNQLLVFQNTGEKERFDGCFANHFSDYTDDHINLHYQS